MDTALRTRTRRKTGRAVKPKPDVVKYLLRLYVNGTTLKSTRAIENLKLVCDGHLQNRYELEVIDIHQQATLARDEQIVAAPTLIKRLPAPFQRLVGDMSDVKKVLFGLDLKTREL